MGINVVQQFTLSYRRKHIQSSEYGSIMSKQIKMTILFLLCAGLWLHAIANSNILYEIVSQCVDTKKPDYCSRCNLKRTDSSCSIKPMCKSSTEVWGETEKFVAIRDIKMCDCPAGFVHGLALPKERISGVEDPMRPDDIWPFAWQVASQYLDQSNIALAVNPLSKRTQHQLHIHIVKKKEISDDASPTVMVEQLQDVWRAAERLARNQGLSEYGVLVVASKENRYRVSVTPGSPEMTMTEATCR